MSFASEADLCAAFIARLPKGWTAYPETGGFDIVLVRDDDGFQIGIEAKLKLNAKVIEQAVEGGAWYYAGGSGPDCRAVLVPDGRTGFNAVCAALGITVIRLNMVTNGYQRLWGCGSPQRFWPGLPSRNEGCREWFERAPMQRISLPDYVPDVTAGASAPTALTVWKIKAIKIAITLERRGYVTRADFKHHQINISRWIAPYAGWLVLDGEKRWIRGPHLPDFRAQHPRNYAEIDADIARWAPPSLLMECE
jgi:hypothetical protein